MDDLPENFGDRILAGGFLGASDFRSGSGDEPTPTPALQRSPSDRAQRDAPPPGFEYVEVMGEGAFGKVFRACELSSGRTVAVKVVTGASDRALKRFEREGSGAGLAPAPGDRARVQLG